MKRETKTLVSVLSGWAKETLFTQGKDIFPL
jgi:hypothetical protein